jgi:nucleoside-diphosphate-sugar epimerase
MDKAILVTGAAGFIGTHLVRALRKAGYQVHSHSRANGDIAHDPLNYDDIRHVFHLAGNTFVPESWEKTRSYYEVNVLGTANVLEFCRLHKAALTLVSSYVYGKPHSLPIAENHPIQPLNPYSHTKILAEEVGRYYALEFGVPVCIVRPFNAYGPGQDSRFLIPKLISQALDPRCEQFAVTDLRPRRDYLHVLDLVSLLLATLEKPDGVYNAGSGRSVSIMDLVTMINALTNSVKPVVSINQIRREEILDVVADVSKAERDFNWTPRISLIDGLRDSIQSMKAVLDASE